MPKTIAKSKISVYDRGIMGFRAKIKKSRFILSCVFLTGYTAYTVYAVYYYRTFGNALSIALLSLIVTSFVLSATITFLSYRINLKDAPRPKLHRFIKMAKYITQLASTAISLSLVISAVHDTNVFSLIMAAISIPFLLWGLFVNVIVEYFDRKFAKGFGKKVFIPSRPLDDEGNELDLTSAISKMDGTASIKKAKKKPRHGI